MAERTLWSSEPYVEQQLNREQKRADYDVKEYPVEVLVQKLKQDDIVIPEYQREFVWDEFSKSRFIESLLVGLPIPYLFAADLAESGKLELIDGVQRISTLKSYMSNELVLEGLDKLGFLDGSRFRDLPDVHQRRFRNRTLRMIVLSERTDPDIRFDLFDRINTGSLTLTPAEIRRAAYRGGFYDVVNGCAANQLFNEMCPLSAKKKKRREGEELVLRFFAYSEQYLDFDHDVARFLNMYLRQKNAEFDVGTATGLYQRQFLRMLASVSRNFPCGFKKTQTATTVPRVRFEAISVGTHLALEAGLPDATRDTAWIDSSEFKELTTTDASNSGPRLRGRIEFVRDRLLGG